MYTVKLVCMHTFYVYTHTHLHTYLYAYACVSVYTYILTYINTYIFVCIYIYICMQSYVIAAHTVLIRPNVPERVVRMPCSPAASAAAGCSLCFSLFFSLRIRVL